MKIKTFYVFTILFLYKTNHNTFKVHLNFIPAANFLAIVLTLEYSESRNKYSLRGKKVLTKNSNVTIRRKDH